jgi:hypothetical protein
MAKRIYKLPHDWRTSGKKVNSKIMDERAALVQTLIEWRDKEFLIVGWHGKSHAIVDYENLIRGFTVGRCYSYDRTKSSTVSFDPHEEAFETGNHWQLVSYPNFFILKENANLDSYRSCYGDKPVMGRAPGDSSINKLLEDMIAYRIFKVLVDPNQVGTAYSYRIEEDV